MKNFLQILQLFWVEGALKRGIDKDGALKVGILCAGGGLKLNATNKKELRKLLEKTDI